jgi:O-antigen/teichoic acid export membrane protein
LPVFAALMTGGGVLLAWVVPVALLIGPVSYVVFARGLPRHIRAQQGRTDPTRAFGRRTLASFLAQDYVASMLNVAAVNMLPLLVVALLGASENAYFFIPFMVAMTLDLLLVNISSSLTVEGSFCDRRLADLVARTVRRFGVPLLVVVPCLVLAAPLLLLLFGEDYRSQGTTVLRILIAACLFRAVLALFTAVSRVRRRARPLVGIHAMIIGTLVLLTLLLSEPLGTEGVALAWLAANAVAAVAVLPALGRSLRQTSGEAPTDA